MARSYFAELAPRAKKGDAALAAPAPAAEPVDLRQVVAPSPEEQRLAQTHQKKSLAGLVEELKKF